MNDPSHPKERKSSTTSSSRPSSIAIMRHEIQKRLKEIPHTSPSISSLSPFNQPFNSIQMKKRINRSEKIMRCNAQHQNTNQTLNTEQDKFKITYSINSLVLLAKSSTSSCLSCCGVDIDVLLSPTAPSDIITDESRCTKQNFELVKFES